MASTRMTLNGLQEGCHSSVLVKSLGMDAFPLPQGSSKVGLCLPLLVSYSLSYFPGGIGLLPEPKALEHPASRPG